MRKILINIIAAFLLLVVGFVSGMCYVLHYNSKYQYTKLGNSYNSVQKEWGNPDVSSTSDDNITETYKIMIVNKYVFIFSKKDSTLIKKWKEY